jgi:predicted ATP-dependent endonuclease of OLD family
MRIAFVEIQNFRKLKSIRVDFDEKTTLLVGPNNSGKTSAMLCLGHFLVDTGRFRTNDFTLSNWAPVLKIGTEWATHDLNQGPLVPQITALEPLLPCLDLWFWVEPHEVHYVYHLLPTLAWSGGYLGVRLRYEPQDLEKLVREYITAYGAAQVVIKSSLAAADSSQATVPIWPQHLREFLDRRLHSHFGVKAYLLDATKLQEPKDGEALPQAMPGSSEPIKGNPLEGLIRIDEIGAQRGLGSAGSLSSEINDGGRRPRDQRRLTEQLRRYYSAHLDPSECPEPGDLKALLAIKEAQDQFDEKLRTGFTPALAELEGLGYPGITDPRLVISSQLKTIDGLDHDAAVQYEVASQVGAVITGSLRLPEEYNGLGYQNLISIVFRLMSFRDAWMQVGKAGKKADVDPDAGLPPLHLVLVEEPEAHLHAQVQQVFIRKAFEILRNHEALGASTLLQTQLIVSTHSSHVAHEAEFNCLRYFRRRPAGQPGDVPTSTVVNLSTVFGSEQDTMQFVARYLTALHSDLFFADAAIFVEGSAEGMLIPHFIRRRYPKLYQRYLTVLEIGGSHAHRFRGLVTQLGLTTLVVTDLDAVDAEQNSVQPARGQGQQTSNETLKSWLPNLSALDALLNLPEEKKALYEGELFAVRVSYQRPVNVTMTEGGNSVETLARTFEDALVFENLSFFRDTQGGASIAKFRKAIVEHPDPTKLGDAMFQILRKISKAAFALDLLFSKEPSELNVPTYLADGLTWLQEQLTRKDQDLIPAVAQPPSTSPEATP